MTTAPMSLLPHQLKLGRLPAARDVRTLEMADYLVPAKLPDVPPTFGWSDRVKAPWGMMLNDSIGDCTIAAIGHYELLWTTLNGTPVVVPDAEILRVYSALSGYDPATGANDAGCIMLRVMNYWRSKGVGGRKIDAYVSVGWRAHKHMMIGIYLAGGINAGVALPISVQSQIRNDSDWSYTGGIDSTPGSWGGHDVVICDYSPAGLGFVSWGRTYRMTWEFADKYIEELYLPISRDWFDPATHHAPNGLNYRAIIADADAIKV